MCVVCYQHRHHFRSLGFLRVSLEGFAWWDGPYGRVSLCQFRDNILIATDFPDDPSTPIVQEVCVILRQCWGLHVFCNCMSQPGDPCMLSCHDTACTALGFDLVRGEGGTGLVYLHPSALSQFWSLNSPPPPLITLALAHPAYLPGIFTGVLVGARPWCRTWAGELLYMVAWAQLAVLSR